VSRNRTDTGAASKGCSGSSQKVYDEASHFHFAEAGKTQAASSSSAGASASPIVGGSAASPPAVAAASTADVLNLTSPFTVALLQLKNSTRGAAYTQALSTLHNILHNVVLHPAEAKYRSIRTSNAAFQSKLGSKPGGIEAIKAAGFSSELEGKARPAPVEPQTEIASAAADAVAVQSPSMAPSAEASATCSAAASAVADDRLVLIPDVKAWEVLQSCMGTLSLFRRAAIDVGLAFLASSSVQLYSAAQRDEVVRMHLEKYGNREQARAEQRESALRAEQSGAGYAFIPEGRMGLVGRQGMTPSNIKGLCTSGLLQSDTGAVLLASSLSLGITILVHLKDDQALPEVSMMLRMYGGVTPLTARVLCTGTDASRSLGSKLIGILPKNNTNSSEFGARNVLMVVTCDAVLVDIEEYRGKPDMFGSSGEMHRRLDIVHHPSAAMVINVGELHHSLPLHLNFTVSHAGYTLERWTPPADNDAVLAPTAAAFIQQHNLVGTSLAAAASSSGSFSVSELLPLSEQFSRWRACFLAGKLRDGTHALNTRKEFSSERELDRLCARQTLALRRLTLLHQGEAERSMISDNQLVVDVKYALTQLESGHPSLLPYGTQLDDVARYFMGAIRHALQESGETGAAAAASAVQSRSLTNSSRPSPEHAALKRLLLRASSEICGTASLFLLLWHLMLALEANAPVNTHSHAIAEMFL
jgi:hypothetical protein